MKTIKIFSRTRMFILVATSCAVFSAAATPIGNSATFSLTISQPGALLPLGPYGTVTLTQQLNEVDVLVTLTSGYAFANTNAGPAFAFNLKSGFTGAAITVDAPGSTFFGSAGPFNATPYGAFTNGIQFLGSAGGGMSGGVTGPLNFDVTQIGIDVTDFSVLSGQGFNNQGHPILGQDGGYLFAADIGFRTSGNTGVVANGDGGGSSDQNDVPEPATIALYGVGLLGAALARRRRKS